MHIRNWINSKRVETRNFVFLFCLVLLSMLTFSVAQAQQPRVSSTSTPVGSSGLNTPAKDITMAGTVQQHEPYGDQGDSASRQSEVLLGKTHDRVSSSTQSPDAFQRALIVGSFAFRSPAFA